MRDIVARVAHSRRVQQTSRRLWRAAPVAAAACLCSAAISRWIGGSPLWPLVVLGAAAGALGAYAFRATRPRPVSDSLAARIDDDGALDGELRSASWFAARDVRDDWTDLHLRRAVERMESLQIARLYPAVRARRARFVTASMLLLTLVLTLTFPHRSAVRAGTSAAATSTAVLPLRPDSPRPAEDTAADLAGDLEALLRAIENGAMPPEGTARAADLQRLLARLRSIHDARTLENLARAMGGNTGSTVDLTPQQMRALAERVKRDSAMARQSEIRESLDKLQAELSQAAQAPPASAVDPRAASTDARSGDAAEANGETGADESVVESSTPVEAGGGMGIMMPDDESSPTADAPPGLGLGGSRSRADTAAAGAVLQQALRHETIEATTNSADGEIISGARRNTRQSNATVSFSGGEGAVWDGSRAGARVPVPEARRTDVRNYFTRRR